MIRAMYMKFYFMLLLIMQVHKLSNSACYNFYFMIRAMYMKFLLNIFHVIAYYAGT
jgi:hypothetical protein